MLLSLVFGDYWPCWQMAYINSTTHTELSPFKIFFLPKKAKATQFPFSGPQPAVNQILSITRTHSLLLGFYKSWLTVSQR